MKAAERYRWQGIGRKVLLIGMILVLGAIFLFGDRGLIKWYRLRQDSRAMEERIDSLGSEIANMSERIRAIEEGDTLELERIARHWGMVRPGEEVYIVREEGDTLQTIP